MASPNSSKPATNAPLLRRRRQLVKLDLLMFNEYGDVPTAGRFGCATAGDQQNTGHASVPEYRE